MGRKINERALPQSRPLVLFHSGPYLSSTLFFRGITFFVRDVLNKDFFFYFDKEVIALSSQIIMKILLGTSGRGSRLLNGSLTESSDGATNDSVGLDDHGRDLGVTTSGHNQVVKTSTDERKGGTGVEREEVTETQEVGVHDGREERGLEAIFQKREYQNLVFFLWQS